MRPTAPRTALFLRLSSLGDVILATAAAGRFKEHFPQSYLTFLTKEAYVPLLQGNPAIDDIEAVPEGESLPAFLERCRRLGPFDAAVDLHGSIRSFFARRAVRASRWYRYSSLSLRRRLWAAGWMRAGHDAETRHVIDRYLAALAPLGVPAGGRPLPRVVLGDEEIEAARALLAGAGIESPFCALAPGARWPGKCWTAAGFARTADRLHDEAGLSILLLGGPHERVTAAAVRELMHAPVVDLTGATGLRGAAAVLKLARIFVGNDSGPGHLAAAVGTPVVAVFGPTTEAFGFAPRGERVAVVSRPLSCRPCSLHGGTRCRRGRRACLDDLPSDEVVEAAFGLIGRPEKAA